MEKGFHDSLIETYTQRSAELFSKDEKSYSIFQERINVEYARDYPKEKEFWDWAEKNLNSKLYKSVYSCYHHEAHAFSASLLSPFNKGVVITADGRGDYESTTISLFDRSLRQPLKKIYTNTSSDSLGFYGRITSLLGFKPCRHEGKVTGLAAKAIPKKALDLIRQMINFKDGKIQANLGNLYRPFYTNFSKELLNLISQYSKEDIAAASKTSRRSLCKLISHIYKENSFEGLPIMMAGGVFGNVKANQIIKELEFVGNAFVQPQMSDGGLCLGAAAASQHIQGIEIKSLKHVNIGPLPKTNIERIQGNKSLLVKEFKDPTEQIILNLTKNKVVGLVRGRMEFGPRALCHRSIIYKTSDRSANDWLNSRMNRTEFMPFAPVMTNEQAKKSFPKFKDDDITLKFMTATLDANNDFCEKCPAVTHIDKTARPQVVNKEDDPFLWNLLTKWEEVSGEYSLINTSFNAHEEPIVCSEKDAIKGLMNKTIDVLFIESKQITLAD